MKRKKKNITIFIITLLSTLVLGLLFILIVLKDNITTPTTMEIIQETFENQENQNVVEDIPKQLVDYSDLSANEIVAKATDGVENYTYSLYCKVDADWVLELSDEDKELLTIMGGTEDGLNFYEIALVSGMVTPEYEYFNYLETVYNLGATTLNNIQQYFDYKENKVYHTSTQNIEETDLDWVEEDSDNLQIKFTDYLSDLTIMDKTEDENNYLISCELQIDNEKSNNLNWLYYNLCNITDADISTKIPVTLEISKETGYLSKIRYDLEIFKGLLLTDTYEISNVEMYYSFVGINETKLEIPKEVKKNFKMKKELGISETLVETTDLDVNTLEFINNIDFEEKNKVNYETVVLLPDIVNAGITLQQEYWGSTDLISIEDFIKMLNGWTINRYSDFIVDDLDSSIYRDITSSIVNTMVSAINTYSEEELMGYIMTELKYDTPLDIKETCGYALLSRIGFGSYTEQYFNMYNNTGKTVDMIIQDIRNM